MCVLMYVNNNIDHVILFVLMFLKAYSIFTPHLTGVLG